MTRPIRSWGELAALLAFLFLILGAATSFVLTWSHFEAQAYNRATGGNVSAWDAVFVELRVQSPASPPE